MPLLAVKLAKQIVHHSASFWFLIQCYLSTVVLYAGLYTLVYRFDVREQLVPLHCHQTRFTYIKASNSSEGVGEALFGKTKEG